MLARQSPNASQLTEHAARKLVAKINASVDDVTNLLIQLYCGKGWAVLGYSCWRKCCEGEFQHSASWACRRIKDAAARDALPMATDGLPDSAIRELRKLPETEREGALSDARERFGESPTAAEIRSVVENYQADDEPYREQPAADEPDEAEEAEAAPAPAPDGLARRVRATVEAYADEHPECTGHVAAVILRELADQFDDA